MRQTDIHSPETAGAIECLCNGCLRVSRIHNYPEDGIGVCAHGGVDMCWCDICMALLAKLRAGIRDSREFDLKISCAEWTWNETDGWEKAVMR
jgi:hypothetical protein